MSSTQLSLGVSFAMALLVANVSGPQYVYPAFGSSLASRFEWTALQNSLVSTASFVGVSFSGPLNSWLIELWGIPNTLRATSLLGFTGFFLLAQTYVGRLPGHFVLSAIYLAMTGIAGAAGYLCALDSQSHNFKSHRGMSMGLTSASIGLSGLVFSQINDHYFKSSSEVDDGTYYFLLFLAVVMATGLMIGSYTLGPLRTDKDINDEYVPIETDDPNIDPSRSILEEARPLFSTRQKEISGLDLLSHPVSLTLFFALFVILGIGYVYLASIGQILSSLTTSSSDHDSQHLRNLHVSIFSIANCASRAIFGTLSDIGKTRFGVHRLWIFWLALIWLVFGMIYLVAMVSTVGDLTICTVVVAIVYGIGFGVAPAVTAEFGAKVFARNWGWLLFAPALGSQLFNVLFGAIYDYQAKQQHSHVCQGPICFQDTFRIAAICSAFCVCMLSWAIYRQGLYRSQKPTAV
ncbi:major facilitator superfamily domain-containing protein [Phycomyces nitens]|nr:major facilitator superfamily domain-containing protein [Phycomyces nitens]